MSMTARQWALSAEGIKLKKEQMEESQKVEKTRVITAKEDGHRYETCLILCNVRYNTLSYFMYIATIIKCILIREMHFRYTSQYLGQLHRKSRLLSDTILVVVVWYTWPCSRLYRLIWHTVWACINLSCITAPANQLSCARTNKYTSTNWLNKIWNILLFSHELLRMLTYKFSVC